MIETTSHFLVSFCPHLPPPLSLLAALQRMTQRKLFLFRSFFHKTSDPAVRTHRSSCKTIRHYLSEKITREKVSIKFNVNIVIRNDRKSEKNVAKPPATPTAFTNCTGSALCVYRIHNWKLENCIMLWLCAGCGWCVWPVCNSIAMGTPLVTLYPKWYVVGCRHEQVGHIIHVCVPSAWQCTCCVGTATTI